METPRRSRGLVDIALLHGFGATSFTWRDVIGPLRGAGHRVEAVDRPWTTLAGQVDATRDALDALDLSSVLLVGHSAGAEVSIALAAQQPSRVRALVLVAPVVGRGVPAPARWLARLPGTSVVAPPLLRAASRWLRPALATAWHDKRRVTDDIVEGYRRPLLEAGVAEALWKMTALKQDRAPRLATAAAVHQPALILVGDHDRWATRPPLPNATTAVIPACGHIPQEEQPARTVAELLTYIRRVAT